MDTKFDYFIEQTNRKLEAMDHKLDQLITFRVMLIGASLAVSVISTATFNLAILYFRSHG